MKNNVLYVHDINVAIDDNKILDSISLKLFPGELCALIGPSGAGKSTLIKVLLGLRTPDRGQVRIGVNQVSETGSIGYVPQDDALHTSLTVFQALDFSAMLRMPKLNALQRKAHIKALARKLQMQEHLNNKIKTLSGGQRKRVSVALELLTQPPVLILDEPTSGLDPGMEARMMHLLKEITENQRIILVATHSMQSLLLCDTVLMLMNGHLVYFAEPEYLLDYFDVTTYEHIFHKLAQHPARHWQSNFSRSHIASRFTHRTATISNNNKETIRSKANQQTHKRPLTRAEEIIAQIKAQQAHLKKTKKT